MIFVDTSVWVDYFRGRKPVVEQMNRLLDDLEVGLCTPVKVEIILGATKKGAAILRRLLGALPEFVPDESDWLQCYDWAKEGRRRGQTFGAVDLLIAAVALRNEAIVWSLDKDFYQMERLGFVELA